jgi:benzodiazapine receptor
MTRSRAPNARGSFSKAGYAALAIGPVAAALLLGQFPTRANVPGWYVQLAKPAFNPPDWVFAPVWSALYILMVIAAWRILRLPSETPRRGRALGLFYLQLCLNAAWPWMFFAAQSPLLGFINIVPQWMAVLAAIAAFGRLDRLAACCLVPLAAWVGFAGVLNAAIWRLNP